MKSDITRIISIFLALSFASSSIGPGFAQTPSRETYRPQAAAKNPTTRLSLTARFAEMTEQMREVSHESRGMFSFGPVRPADEMRLRQDEGFRSEFIAGMSLVHSSSGIGVALALQAITDDIMDFLELLKASKEKIDSTATLRLRTMDAHFDIIDRTGPQWRLRFPTPGTPLDRLREELEKFQGTFGDLNAHLDELHEVFVSDVIGGGIRDSIQAMPPGDEKQEAEEKLAGIERDFPLLLDFIRDRAPLAQAQVTEDAACSFSDIQDRLIEHHREHYNAGLFIIDVDGLSENTPVEMPPARLFSLINNLVANAFAHNPEGTRVYLRLRTRTDSGELEIMVSDTGNPLAAEYFEPRTNGLIRLVDLEKKEDDRIPIGHAEVWDITGIAGGTYEIRRRIGTDYIEEAIKILDEIAAGEKLPEEVQGILDGDIEPVWGVNYTPLTRAMITIVREREGEPDKAYDDLNRIGFNCTLNSCGIDLESEDANFLRDFLPRVDLSADENMRRLQVMRAEAAEKQLTVHQIDVLMRFYETAQNILFEVGDFLVRNGKHEVAGNDFLLETVYGILDGRLEGFREKFKRDEELSLSLAKGYREIKLANKSDAIKHYSAALAQRPDAESRIIDELISLRLQGHEIAMEVMEELGLERDVPLASGTTFVVTLPIAAHFAEQQQDLRRLQKTFSH